MNKAFILNSEKIKTFLSQKSTSKDAIDRFNNHKPIKNVIVPFK